MEGSVEERMKKVVAEVFGKDITEISSETEFIQDLHAKSIDIVELIAAVEEEFGIPVIQAQVMQNKSVGMASDWMKGKLKQAKEQQGA
jgi:acyl carrier protein